METVAKEFELLPIDRVVWDHLNPNNPPPGDFNHSADGTKLSNFFDLKDGRNLLESLHEDFRFMERSNSDMLITYKVIPTI